MRQQRTKEHNKVLIFAVAVVWIMLFGLGWAFGKPLLAAFEDIRKDSKDTHEHQKAQKEFREREDARFLYLSNQLKAIQKRLDTHESATPRP